MTCVRNRAPSPAVTTGKTVECPALLLDATRDLPPLRTAIANAGTDLVMESVRDACEAGLIEPLLVGDPEDIKACADRLESGSRCASI